MTQCSLCRTYIDYYSLCHLIIHPFHTFITTFHVLFDHYSFHSYSSTDSSDVQRTRRSGKPFLSFSLSISTRYDQSSYLDTLIAPSFTHFASLYHLFLVPLNTHSYLTLFFIPSSTSFLSPSYLERESLPKAGWRCYQQEGSP